MAFQQNATSELHVVLIPSAGMGHLNPFSCLAASLANHCKVSMVSVIPAVSDAESRHLCGMFSANPQINPIEFQLPSHDLSDNHDADPFVLRWELISQSSPDILSYVMETTSIPVTAIVVDIPIAASFVPLVKSLGIPCYIMYISTAAMLSFLAYFPTYCTSKTTADLGDVEIPGYRTVPWASIPSVLHDPNNLFTKQFIQNAQVLLEVDGIFVNTFESFEKDSLAALRDGRVQPGFPPLIPVGPLIPLNMPTLGDSEVLLWLDQQPANSVVYVNFGNRTGMSREQIHELGLGLETSGCRFLWVVKAKTLDSQDVENLGDILEKGYLERVKHRGFVTKGWVDQDKILRHKAIGCFLSHSGSNSLIEAAMHGIRMLAWPMGGDQRINAGNQKFTI